MHIHAKVHLDSETVLTTQFYFDDDVTARVFTTTGLPGRVEPRRLQRERRALRPGASSLTLSEEGEGYRGRITLDVARA